MIAADTSTVIAFIQDDSGADVGRFEDALRAGEIALPPVVLTEVLSEYGLPARHRTMVLNLPLLQILDQFWSRAAQSRATILSRKLRARLADTLIAQSCIDHDVALITRDSNFRHFAKHCGLKLV